MFYSTTYKYSDVRKLYINIIRKALNWYSNTVFYTTVGIVKFL